jgi:hypothetical protein
MAEIEGARDKGVDLLVAQVGGEDHVADYTMRRLALLLAQALEDGHVGGGEQLEASCDGVVL